MHRMFVGCRTIKHKSEMIRIVRTLENKVEIDENGKKAGRGAYICQNPECLKTAKKKKALNKYFKRNIEEYFYDEVEQFLLDSRQAT